MKPAYLIILLFLSQDIFAQSEKKGFLPTSVVNIQHAGSIGFFSAGYFRQSANKKIELGLLYGYTPESVGGEIHTIALKFIYEPFRINIKPRFQIEPVQAGTFISQHFGENLHLTWPDKYSPGYYSWNNSTRIHIFVGAQVSYVADTRVVDKISFYFETNTNDLYIESYTENDNWKPLALSDIFFFGVGIKVYFK